MINKTRQVTFHLLSHYADDNSGGRRADANRGLGHAITATAESREPLGNVTQRAVRESGEVIPSALVHAVEENRFYLTGWRPTSGWQEDQDEEYLTYMIEGDAIVVLFPFDHFRLTPGGVAETIEAGYLDAEVDHFVVHTHEGRGGDFGAWDIVTWLYGQGVDVGVPLVRDGLINWVAAWVTRRLRNSYVDRRARMFALRWENRNIRSPFHIRFWLDKKDRWTVEEIDRRLFDSENAGASKKLLEALGYEEDAGNGWRLGVSKRAKRRRASWLAGELDGGLKERETFWRPRWLDGR